MFRVLSIGTVPVERKESLVRTLSFPSDISPETFCIGEVLKEPGNREKVFLATKFGKYPMFAERVHV